MLKWSLGCRGKTYKWHDEINHRNLYSKMLLQFFLEMSVLTLFQCELIFFSSYSESSVMQTLIFQKILDTSAYISHSEESVAPDAVTGVFLCSRLSFTVLSRSASAPHFYSLTSSPSSTLRLQCWHSGCVRPWNLHVRPLFCVEQYLALQATLSPLLL